MNRRYAERTIVPVAKSQEALRKILRDIGATGFAVMNRNNSLQVGFELLDRAIRFDIPVEQKKDQEREERIVWRALLLCVKAKVEAMRAGITTFEQEFLPHFVMKDGRTVGDSIIPQIQDGSSTLKLLPM